MRMMTIIALLAALSGLPRPALADAPVQEGHTDQYYEQWYLHGSREVQLGKSARLWISYTPMNRMAACAVADGDCDLRLEADPPVVAINWAVNGIVGGNAEVGTITGDGGARARYTAPKRTPKTSPMSISAEVVGVKGMTLVTELTVVPSKEWSGRIDYGFSGTRQEGKEGEEGYRISDVEFHQAFTVKALVSDSYNDDGSGTVILALEDEAEDYTRATTERSTCHHYERTHERITDNDDLLTPLVAHTVQFSLSADHRVTIPYFHGTPVEIIGRWSNKNCQGGIKPTSGEIPLSMLGVVTFMGPFEGKPGTAHQMEGSVTVKDVPYTFEGIDFKGEMFIQWQLERE